MSEGVESFPTSGVVVLGRKSWTAYLRPTLVACFWAAIAVTAPSEVLRGTIRMVSVAYLVARFISVRSFRLYVDDRGVWVYQGFLPWTTGAYGVLWQHLDQAMFRRGFVAWLTGSYRVHVVQRFTQRKEIKVRGIHRGNRVAMQINRMHPHTEREANRQRGLSPDA